MHFLATVDRSDLQQAFLGEQLLMPCLTGQVFSVCNIGLAHDIACCGIAEAQTELCPPLLSWRAVEYFCWQCSLVPRLSHTNKNRTVSDKKMALESGTGNVNMKKTSTGTQVLIEVIAVTL